MGQQQERGMRGASGIWYGALRVCEWVEGRRLRGGWEKVSGNMEARAAVCDVRE